MNNEILNKVGLYLTEKALTAALPEGSSAENTETFDPKDMQALLNRVLTGHSTARMLIATSSEDIARVLLALNATISSYKLTVLCNGVLHDTDALAELEHEEKMLHTADGTEHFPAVQLHSRLYADEQGALLLEDAQDVDGCTPLLAKDGGRWGTLLEGRTSEMFAGTAEHSEELSICERAQLCIALADRVMEQGLPVPSREQILLLRKDGKLEPLFITQENDAEQPLSELLYEIFTGHRLSEYDSAAEVLVYDAAVTEIPSIFFEDMMYAYASAFYPDRSDGTLTARRVRNTMERIIMNTEEGFYHE